MLKRLIDHGGGSWSSMKNSLVAVNVQRDESLIPRFQLLNVNSARQTGSVHCAQWSRRSVHRPRLARNEAIQPFNRQSTY